MSNFRQLLLESNYQSVIEQAIQDGWLLRISYKGEGANRFRNRVVEPFSLGYYKPSGNLVLAAWHNRGFSLSQDKPEWRLYRLDRLSQCALLKHNKDPRNPKKGIRQVRPGYNPPDQRLSNILADIIDNFKPVADRKKEREQPKPVDPTLVDKEDDSEKELSV